MSYHNHKVSIKELRELENGEFNLLIEGYDAENSLDFLEIVHILNGGQVKGLCMDPAKSKLSSSCRAIIRTFVIRTITEERKRE